MKHIILPLALVALAFSANGQTYRQYMKAADEQFAQQNYYATMKYLQEAMSIEGEQPEVLFKYGEAARLYNAFTFADTAYTKVLSSEKAGEFPLAKYWLATVKKKVGKYEEAQSLFQSFVDEHPSTFSNYTGLAQEEIATLDWAISAIKNPDDNVTVEHLGDDINTPNSEFAPVLKGSDLYYSSLLKEQEGRDQSAPRPHAQVLRSKNEGKKIDPVSYNDNKKHTAYSAFDKNNTTIYYSLCDWVGESAEIRCELWSRPVDEKGNFGEPVKLAEPINKTDYTNEQPMVAFDEESGKQWMFFVSNRPGGQGKLDIWVSVIGEDGSFSKPENLAGLNTPGNDVSPFYHSLSKTLYFSSDERQGFGGYDIFKATKKDGDWADIENLPAPYNSSYNDTHFWMNDSRTKGYFSSSRLGSLVLEPEFEACCNDLYGFTVQIVDLKILTFNKRDDQPLEGVTIKFKELTKEGEIELATVTNPTGNDFNFEMKRGAKYVVLASKPTFLTLTDTIDMTLPANLKEREIERKLYLVPEKVDLHVATFHKTTLKPLKGVEVRLVANGREVSVVKNEQGNDFDFVLERGQQYQVIGSKIAYVNDTLDIDLRTDITTARIDEKLYLRPKKLEDYPPLYLYFDNDQPDPRSPKPTTDKNYVDTWEPYSKKKDIFMEGYTQGLTGMDSISAASRMTAFFDREIGGALLDLEAFTSDILNIMQDGSFKVELEIQGSTSPRASEAYNLILSERRSNCLKNHFETWQGGILKQYMDQGKIKITVVGFGEMNAPKFISDRLEDERESIYSVLASLQRKVAIIGARKVAENTN